MPGLDKRHASVSTHVSDVRRYRLQRSSQQKIREKAAIVAHRCRHQKRTRKGKQEVNLNSLNKRGTTALKWSLTCLVYLSVDPVGTRRRDKRVQSFFVFFYFSLLHAVIFYFSRPNGLGAPPRCVYLRIVGLSAAAVTLFHHGCATLSCLYQPPPFMSCTVRQACTNHPTPTKFCTMLLTTAVRMCAIH